MLSKCTEVGTDHIALVHFERSVRQGKESAIERYQNLTISACKQCGRNILPRITGPQKLTETIHELKQQYPQSRLIYGSLQSDAAPLGPGDYSDDVVVFVGPEGGDGCGNGCSEGGTHCRWKPYPAYRNGGNSICGNIGSDANR
jgi:16S rRNA (uracil1498-N3)-methyltransferase